MPEAVCFDDIIGWGAGVDADATMAGRLCSAAIRPFSERRERLEIALSVSKTPVPFVAEASYHSVERSGLRAASSETPISARFWRRLRRLSMLGSFMVRCESATNTIPYTTLRTSFRVVL